MSAVLFLLAAFRERIKEKERKGERGRERERERERERGGRGRGERENEREAEKSGGIAGGNGVLFHPFQLYSRSPILWRLTKP